MVDGKTWWIDEVHGSDENGGTSLEDAFRTRVRALAAFQPGEPRDVIIELGPEVEIEGHTLFKGHWFQGRALRIGDA